MTNGRKPTAVFLDFDGVILDSARLKTAAYLDIYDAQPQPLRDKIKRFCDDYSGLPRDAKFRMIQEEILGVPVSAARLGELHEQFAAKVYERVVQAEWIPGAFEFLAQYHREYQLFVISGTPHDELHEICRRRNISSFFVQIGGGPTSKVDWMRRYFASYSLEPSDAVMVGDSLVDMDAANECGVRFIGIQEDQDGAVQFGPETQLLKNLVDLPCALVQEISSRAALPYETRCRN